MKKLSISKFILLPHRNSEESKISNDKRGKKGLEKVRGHFKGQRLGKGLSKSKVLWIKPYIRGEGAEYFRKERIYKVI